MSFSTEVKNELAKQIPAHKHCQLSELSALFTYGNIGIIESEGEKRLRFLSENELITKKVFTIIKKSFNIKLGVFVQKMGQKNKNLYGVDIYSNTAIKTVLSFIRVSPTSDGTFSCTQKPERMSSCCRFSFIRGAFLMLGSISDPAKSYHMEFDISHDGHELIQAMLKDIAGEVKVSLRKGKSFIYIKDSSIISDVLAAMGASVSMLNFENMKIINETRGMVNRRVNCEIGNLKKSAEAGHRQIQDIELIIDRIGLDNLPGNLKEIATLRIENPEASLQELGELMNPPLGRSGVNHRLQKLMSIAEELKTS
ncbi:MAG: DNA-binding protein WhiA [Lachnospiraceae bacterium]